MALNQGDPCPTCTNELVTISITVDGNELDMMSCSVCDTRTWSHAGRPVDLPFALAEVGEHAGRQR